MLKIKVAYAVYWTVASVFVGILLAPFVTAKTPEDHSGHITHDHSITHGKIEVNPDLIPRVKIRAVPDKRAGWNIYLDVENFEFTPGSVNLKHLPNQGHAHLYVDGVKQNRLYSKAFHLARLPPGKHVVSVSLNANDHSSLALKGVPISASTTVIETGKR